MNVSLISLCHPSKKKRRETVGCIKCAATLKHPTWKNKNANDVFYSS